MKSRIVLAGGSGFLGRALAAEFSAHGYSVVILTRTPRPRTDEIRELAWDGKNPGAWTAELAGAAALINLTGKNINCPHTPENLRGITASRVESVNVLAAACASLTAPPRVWVQASATGFYGDSGAATCDETAPVGTDALANICRQWEGAFAAAALPATRKVTLRIGFVLGRDGGALPVLARLAKLFLGGAAGNGRQFISWIHLADLVRIFAAAVENEELSGTFNAVAPNPVTNAAFMCELRGVLGRPWSPPAPKWAVQFGAKLLGSEPSLALVSQRSTPAKISATGFQFQFPQLRSALENLCD